MPALRTLATAAAVGLTTLAVVAPPLTPWGAPGSAAAPSEVTDDEAAAAGARWLAAQVTDDGYVAGPGGTPAPAATLNVGLALAATGTEGDVLSRIVDWAASDPDTVVVVGSDDDAGRLGALVMLVVAVGDDPHAFGGVDLVDRLEETLGDLEPGLYGASDPTYDGAYRQGLALLGLAAAGAASPTAGLAWLVDQQCVGDPATAAGGWMAYRGDTGAPCVAPDPATFTGPDTNQTALALSALEVWSTAAPADPLAFLASAQTADGGFAYLPGGATDANSTALVLQALLAADEELADWDTDGGGPLSSLLSWQLGCDADPADVGAFASPWSEGAPDALATQQAVPAVALQPFPLGPVVEGPSLDPCAAPVTSTTTSTTTPITGATTSTTTGSTTTSALAPTTTIARSAATAVAATPTYAG